jgi:hypothetical protein
LSETQRRAPARPGDLLSLFRPERSLLLRINPPVTGKKTPCYRNKKRRAGPSFRRSPSADGRAGVGRNPVEFQKDVIFRLPEVSTSAILILRNSRCSFKPAEMDGAKKMEARLQPYCTE